MLERIQRGLGLTVLALLIAWAAYGVAAGRTDWAMAGPPVLLFLFAGLMLADFLCMRQVNSSHGVRVDWNSWLWAWWGEVRCALRVFGWQQPWRSRRFPDRLDAGRGGQRGVLLVHGYFCNRGVWNPWMERLTRARVPFLAVNLEPVFGGIDDYPPIITAAVARLQQHTGMAPVIVAHSMGGLVARSWLTETGNAPRVHHVITLGSPHRGTWMARFGLSRNARQMRQGSRWLGSLAEREADIELPPFTCYYSTLDNIAFPAATGTLPRADNRCLHGAAHVDMVQRVEPWQELQRLLASTSHVADATTGGLGLASGAAVAAQRQHNPGR